MAKRRNLIKVVIDTNVFVGNFLSHRPGSPNRRVIRLWLVERLIRLALSSAIQEEYLRIFSEVLGFETTQNENWRRRFGDKKSCAIVRPRTKSSLSRDPNDNIFIAVASSAKAKFLVTNDLDLLDIDEANKQRLQFEIVTPKHFLRQWDSLT